MAPANLMSICMASVWGQVDISQIQKLETHVAMALPKWCQQEGHFPKGRKDRRPLEGQRHCHFIRGSQQKLDSYQSYGAFLSHWESKRICGGQIENHKKFLWARLQHDASKQGLSLSFYKLSIHFGWSGSGKENAENWISTIWNAMSECSRVSSFKALNPRCS